MSNLRYTTYNAAHREYAYRWLTGVPEKTIKELEPEERKIFQDETTIHRFCENAPEPKINLLLTKTGVVWCMVFGPDHETIKHTIFCNFNQYEYPLKRVDAIETTSRNNVYATGSAELMLAIQMTAQNCSTKVYAMSQFTKDLMARRKGFNKMRSTKDDYTEGAEAYTDFAKLVAEQLNSFDWALTELYLSQPELRILCTLFANRTTAMTLTEIMERTKLGGRKMYLGKFIDGLMIRKLIMSDNKAPGKLVKSKAYYMITGEGIKKTAQYIQYLHKQTFEK